VRIGVFGGVFNPPHVGHLVCAQEALVQLGLDVVVFVPVGRAPHREVPDDPGAEARLTMCEYAVTADERFRLSRAEVDREGPSYTVDTLRAFRDRGELVLLLGGDQAAALPDWHEPEEVASLVGAIGVAERVDADRARIEARVGEVPGAGERLSFFEMPRIDVSSTLVRRRAASGLPIRYLVPDKVASYIGAQSLYGSAPPAAVAAADGGTP
jgi:nicotinate-nucleotide adenylyltransferase